MTVNRANEVAKEIVDTAEDCPHCFGEDVVHDQSKRNHRELWLSEECLVERIATAIQSEVDAAVRAENLRCLSAVDNEPENPGKMPDEMWEAISRDRDACEKAFQINTALTKRNISQSIRLSKLEKESK